MEIIQKHFTDHFDPTDTKSNVQLSSEGIGNDHRIERSNDSPRNCF